MSESNEYVADRTGWGHIPGPWQNEPQDKEVWVDPDTDLDCMIIRGPLGSWCGYVAVTPDHPDYGKNYFSVDFDVHGGLTYADRCGDHICHVPEAGREADVWWFGFDCAHGGDICPGMIGSSLGPVTEDTPQSEFWHRTYKDVEYVKREVRGLARQLVDRSWGDRIGAMS